MPILYQKEWYTREQIRAQREKLFVFGDNLARRGLGGQAKAARGEPNAAGVVTKRAPTNGPDEFFTNADLDMLKDVWKKDFFFISNALEAGRVVVWPADGIGTGLARLPETAPLCWDELERMRKQLERMYGVSA